MAKTKKISKKIAALLNGLYKIYNDDGNTVVMVGEDDKTKINQEDIIAIATSKVQGHFDLFAAENTKMLKNLGLNAEIKMIVKLKPE